ncbi:GNAT family N-acetyltransferase [Alicyclobacillus sp. SO9]|nr:GNAT family N-acetyltransferase [Alicyclobacillus sp. SO9]
MFGGEFAGSISVRRREEDGMGAVDYWVAPPFWNKGIGTKAVKAAVEYGFNDLNIKTFETFCLADNVGSSMVLEHNGFELVNKFTIGSGFKHEGQLAKLYRLDRQSSAIAQDK